MTDLVSAHLTQPNPELAGLISATPFGMAHWSGTGPAGATCGKCAHYGYSYTTESGKDSRKLSACEKYWRMTSRHGGSLAAQQPACKYFEPSK